MSRGQRLGFLAVAALIAVAAVVLLGSEGGGGEPRRTTTATAPSDPPSTAGAKSTATPASRPRPPLLRAGGDAELEVREGDTVRFRVRSANADHVHVHGYDVIRDVPAGETVNVRFRADIPGVFEIELEETHQPLGRLKVQP